MAGPNVLFVKHNKEKDTAEEQISLIGKKAPLEVSYFNSLVREEFCTVTTCFPLKNWNSPIRMSFQLIMVSDCELVNKLFEMEKRQKILLFIKEGEQVSENLRKNNRLHPFALPGSQEGFVHYVKGLTGVE